jgi:hypothetical protein
VRFERDRVRLLREVSGVPSGTEGIVLGFKEKLQLYVVQFGGWGVHEVPEDSIEAIS